jgi:hypothetical protein
MERAVRQEALRPAKSGHRRLVVSRWAQRRQEYQPVHSPWVGPVGMPRLLSAPGKSRSKGLLSAGRILDRWRTRSSLSPIIEVSVDLRRAADIHPLISCKNLVATADAIGYKVRTVCSVASRRREFGPTYSDQLHEETIFDRNRTA